MTPPLVRYFADIPLAFDNLRAQKTRTVLTALGIVFGVGSVIGMLAIGAGAREESLSFIERLGVRNVLIESIPATSIQEMQQRRRIVPAARDLRDDVHGARRVAHDEHDAAQLIEPERARPQNGAAEQEQDRDGDDEDSGEREQLAACHRSRSARVGLRRTMP